MALGLSGTHAGAAPSIRPGTKGSFTFNHLKVWYRAPADLAGARVLIVMHGQERNAKSYRNSWVREARRAKALLIVPEFSNTAYPGDAYTLGPQSFRTIEPLYDFVRAKTGNRSAGYLLYGHSAGAQFVHRLLLLVPNNRVKRAVAANAGWYTAPKANVKYPYGVRNAPASASTSRLLAARLTILLGKNDTDPNDPDLRHTAGADRQGPHRLARGKYFYNAGISASRALGAPFHWRIQTVPGVGHSNVAMVPAAARRLFALPR